MNRSQIKAMLLLQDKMNTKVHINWREQNFEWYRAIWVECAELLDHYGWKWWKKQTIDKEQVVLELIDIWHFGLSDLLANNDDIEALSDQLLSVLEQKPERSDFKDDLESFAAHTLVNKSFNTQLFHVLLLSMGQTFDDLYKKYMGKNVLNFFRQDHGYKTGEYHKIWHGKEDNEHLVEIVESLNTGDDSDVFQAQVYEGLKARYPSQ